MAHASALEFDGSFADWKRAARTALADGLEPAQIRWVDLTHGDAQEHLALAEEPPHVAPTSPPVVVARTAPRVPRAFLELGTDAACHRDPARWPLL